jgi:NAD(P)-dependent dehydrogenase (short-subunit alcohol dehydrogenase family)
MRPEHGCAAVGEQDLTERRDTGIIAVHRPVGGSVAPAVAEFSGSARRRVTSDVLIGAMLIVAASVPGPVGKAAGAADAASAVQAQAADDRADRRIVLITGSTDGLGREVARRLAATGAHIIVHGRNRERGLELVREIEAGGVGSAAFYAADFASLAEVRALGEAILRDYDRLDVLINNAGIWIPGSERRFSADGHELHFAVNYLAGYVLTRMLLPRLVASAPARIINVASAAQTPLDFDDVMLERSYNGGRAYAQSKLAQVLFTVDLARELAGSDVMVLALHPATLMDTRMVHEAGATPRSTVAEGAEAVINLVTSGDVASGQYFNGLRPARANAQAYDDAALEALRGLSAALTR